jgi:hypothetical protein
LCFSSFVDSAVNIRYYSPVTKSRSSLTTGGMARVSKI